MNFIKAKALLLEEGYQVLATNEDGYHVVVFPNEQCFLLEESEVVCLIDNSNGVPLKKRVKSSILGLIGEHEQFYYHDKSGCDTEIAKLFSQVSKLVEAW